MAPARPALVLGRTGAALVLALVLTVVLVSPARGTDSLTYQAGERYQHVHYSHRLRHHKGRSGSPARVEGSPDPRPVWKFVRIPGLCGWSP